MPFKKRLHITAAPLLLRWAGRTRRAVATSVSPPSAEESPSRLISAEVVHGGDEQEFWMEKRSFYRRRAPFMPSWDRFAHTLILMTRKVVRVPPEAAFRLMAVFLKMMFMVSIGEVAQLMMPQWLLANQLTLPQRMAMVDVASEAKQLAAKKAETEKGKGKDEPGNADDGNKNRDSS